MSIRVGILTTLVIGFGYLGVQQALRQGADHPQTELARDASALLDGGATPRSVMPATVTVDLSSSPDAFLAIYDVAGRPLATNGSLDGAAPAPPVGVLDSARATGRDRVTWQPRQGVRIALIVLPWQGGTVLAGRSLRDVERQEDTALLVAFSAWVVSIGLIGAVSLW